MTAPVRRPRCRERANTSRTVSVAGATRRSPPLAHDRLDLEQLAAQAAGRVEAGEVLVREVALAAEDEGQRVADGDHGRGAGAGGEAERADLLERAVDQGDVGLAGEGAGRVAGQADDGAATNGRSGPSKRTISSLSPLCDRTRATSSGWTMPRSPWTARVASRT